MTRSALHVWGRHSSHVYQARFERSRTIRPVEFLVFVCKASFQSRRTSKQWQDSSGRRPPAPFPPARWATASHAVLETGDDMETSTCVHVIPLPRGARVAMPPATNSAPFPMRGLLIISASLLTDGLVASSLFPFVPYLIADCGVPEPEVGYYVRVCAQSPCAQIC